MSVLGARLAPCLFPVTGRSHVAARARSESRGVVAPWRPVIALCVGLSGCTADAAPSEPSANDRLGAAKVTHVHTMLVFTGPEGRR